MRRAIRKHLRDFAAIVALAALAAGVGGYVLAHQRLRFPWEGAPFRIKAEFATAQAVTPGQGQTVRVSGVRVGDITKVDLKDGRAVVTMDLDPEYKGFVHTDASALLRPKTGLKDMFIELDPGTRPRAAGEGGLDASRSATPPPDVNPDEIFSVLDDDTRDYLKLLIGGAGQGLAGRGGDLRDLFRRFEPTHKDLERVNGAVAAAPPQPAPPRPLAGRAQHRARGQGRPARRARRLLLEGVPHVRLGAAEPRPGRRRDLPGTLRQTTDTLGKVERFARVLRPTADDLRPPVQGARPRERAGQAARRGGDPDRPRADPPVRARRAPARRARSRRRRPTSRRRRPT